MLDTDILDRVMLAADRAGAQASACGGRPSASERAAGRSVRAGGGACGLDGAQPGAPAEGELAARGERGVCGRGHYASADRGLCRSGLPRLERYAGREPRGAGGGVGTGERARPGGGAVHLRLDQCGGEAPERGGARDPGRARRDRGRPRVPDGARRGPCRRRRPHPVPRYGPSCRHLQRRARDDRLVHGGDDRGGDGRRRAGVVRSGAVRGLGDPAMPARYTGARARRRRRCSRSTTTPSPGRRRRPMWR